jgi:hypothetical protein
MFYHLKHWLTQEQIRQVQEQIAQCMQNTPKPLSDPNTHGTEIDLTTSRRLVDIKDAICQWCEKIYQTPLTCNNYWISISKPGTSVVSHDHVEPGSHPQVSVVLYIDAPPDCGQLYLENYNQRLAVGPGDLVCFPAECVHSVDTNSSTLPRVCVAFDLFGPAGAGDK